MNKYKEDLQIYKESIEKLGKSTSFDRAKRVRSCNFNCIDQMVYVNCFGIV